jgi:hypothetical protein
VFLGAHSVRKIDLLAVHIFHAHAYGIKDKSINTCKNLWLLSFSRGGLPILFNDNESVDKKKQEYNHLKEKKNGDIMGNPYACISA